MWWRRPHSSGGAIHWSVRGSSWRSRRRIPRTCWPSWRVVSYSCKSCCMNRGIDRSRTWWSCLMCFEWLSSTFNQCLSLWFWLRYYARISNWPSFVSFKSHLHPWGLCFCRPPFGGAIDVVARALLSESEISWRFLEVGAGIFDRFDCMLIPEVYSCLLMWVQSLCGRLFITMFSSILAEETRTQEVIQKETQSNIVNVSILHEQQTAMSVANSPMFASKN